MLRIRRADPTDATALATLRWRFHEEDGAAATQSREAFTTAFADFWDAADREGRWAVWIAEWSGEAIGTAWIARVDRVPLPDGSPVSLGYLTNVYVVEDWRNQGIGSALLGAASSWARGENLELLVVWPSGPSESFYKRHGFTPSGAQQLML